MSDLQYLLAIREEVAPDSYCAQLLSIYNHFVARPEMPVTAGNIISILDTFALTEVQDTDARALTDLRTHMTSDQSSSLNSQILRQIFNDCLTLLVRAEFARAQEQGTALPSLVLSSVTVRSLQVILEIARQGNGNSEAGYFV